MRRPRLRFTVIGLMIAVAVFALAINGLRPMSRGEAVAAAWRRFREVPGASAWDEAKVNAYISGGGDGHNYWIVNFQDPANGKGIAQVSMYQRGGIAAVTLFLSESGSPTPVELLDRPLPPPESKRR